MATKHLTVVYSTQRTGFEKQPGRAYSNPRLFTTARSDATKVILVGDWPVVAKTYKALGIPVVQLQPGDRLETAMAPAGAAPGGDSQPAEPDTATDTTPAPTATDRAEVDIPDDWRDLKWSTPDPVSGMTLRGLAAKVADRPIMNTAMAVAAITAELGRRASAGASS